MVQITSDYAERVYAGVLGKVIGVYPVSYTHLTLPTIYSV